jgi:hypothetical protein
VAKIASEKHKAKIKENAAIYNSAARAKSLISSTYHERAPPLPPSET